MPKKDYYSLLGVAQNSTKEEIKKKYRELAHKYHPDKGGDEARFKEINEAYQVLSDDQKRAQYDQFGQVFSDGGGSASGGEWPGGFRFDFGDGRPFDFAQGDFDFSNIFEDFFGGNFGGGTRARTRERKGRDLRIDLDISFEESVLGGKRGVEIEKLSRCSRCSGSGGEPGAKLKNCPTCQGKGNVQKNQRTFLGSFTQVTICPECAGSGKKPEIVCIHCKGRGVEQKIEQLEVFIPKGIRDGEVLKITGKGEASLTGGTPGDLYIRLRVAPHKIFRRQGDDLIMQLPLRLSQAILGGAISVDTLDGSIQLKIPEGTQAGDILKVRGKGSYLASGYGRGDLFIEIKVEIPKKPVKQIKEIAEKLKEEGF
ncbi:MAG: molecular chaperone DnaJ [Candidatus Sungbacteria bacterium]|nr:molecular chaperone DnaJ [Candidatus Sungbacteria bacterium]